MKKKLILFMTVIAMLAMSISVSADELEEKEYQFRGYKWLSPYREIKLNEYDPGMVEGVDFDTFDTEEEKSFCVVTDVAGLKANALFLFNDDWKLIMGCYEILTEHSTPIDYYSDYVTLKNALVSLYGEPISAQKYGLDDVDLDKPDEIVSRLLSKSAVIYDYWISDDDSAIALVCTAMEGIIRPSLFYCQDIDEFSEIITNLSAINTNGL